MTPPNLVDAVKTGNCEAIAQALTCQIASHLNQSLSIQVRLRHSCLLILLSSQTIPDQGVLLPYIEQAVRCLQHSAIQTVKVYGRQNGANPAWATTIELASKSSHTTHKINFEPNRQHDRPLTTRHAKAIFKVGGLTYTTHDLQLFIAQLDPLKAGFIALLAIYGWVGASNYTVEGFLDGSDRIMMFLHGVNLIFHEAGHTIFAGFGQFFHILGGSLMQVLVPAVIAAYFCLTRQFYASTIALCWTAQNLWDVSIYIKDAQERVIPLLGGEAVLHDWHFLLLDLRLLTQDQRVGGIVFSIGSLLYLAAVVAGFYFAQKQTVKASSR